MMSMMKKIIAKLAIKYLEKRINILNEAVRIFPEDEKVNEYRAFISGFKITIRYIKDRYL